MVSGPAYDSTVGYRTRPFRATAAIAVGRHERRLDCRPRSRDARIVIFVRLAYTVAVMVIVIWLLRTGNPVGGLFLVPAAAVWLRREAESERLSARARRALRP
jgi:hypothetical protein